LIETFRDELLKLGYAEGAVSAWSCEMRLYRSTTSTPGFIKHDQAHFISRILPVLFLDFSRETERRRSSFPCSSLGLARRKREDDDETSRIKTQAIVVLLQAENVEFTVDE
jgi:hypothetical protein